MSPIPDEIAAFVSRELKARANPIKAASMAGYMKTNMPFYGVYKPCSEKSEADSRYCVSTRYWIFPALVSPIPVTVFPL